MIVGIEETTDVGHRQTRIVRFRTEGAARRWLEHSGGFAWPAAADIDLPARQQNWHRRFREAHVLRPRFRLDEREVRRMVGWPHYRLPDEVRASMYRQASVREIKAEEVGTDGRDA